MIRKYTTVTISRIKGVKYKKRVIKNHVNSVLEKKLKSIIYPMYLIQILLLSSKYVIKGNVIKHIKIKSHLAVFLSVVAFTTYIISSKVLCYNYFEDGDSETTTLDAS